MLVGFRRASSSSSASTCAASRSYCRPGLRQGVDFEAARRARRRLGLLQRLHDVRIRAAQLDDRANHFVDARRDDPLLRLGAGRESADRNLAAALAVDQDVLARIEHQRQLEMLVLAEQHDFGQMAARDVDHVGPGHVEHVVVELVAELLAAHERIVLVHRPQRAERTVAGFGAAALRAVDASAS